jgi:acetylglutamate kinase
MKAKGKNIIIVKIGGSTLGQNDTTLQDIVAIQKKGLPLIVVHGGGKIVTDWLARMGTPTRFVQGERVTDRASLEITTAVLSGIVNKELVASINRLGGKAAGVSGVDGALLQGSIKAPELGYVGTLVAVNTALLETLMAGGFIPVVSSISLNSDGNPDTAPLLLNVNADIAAGEIAAVLEAEKLIFLTDMGGICDKSGNVISRISASDAEALTGAGVASGGMIPKIRAAIRALNVCASARIIDGRQPHALLKEIEGGEGGTTIIANTDLHQA